MNASKITKRFCAETLLAETVTGYGLIKLLNTKRIINDVKLLKKLFICPPFLKNPSDLTIKDCWGCQNSCQSPVQRTAKSIRVEPSRFGNVELFFGVQVHHPPHIKLTTRTYINIIYTISKFACQTQETAHSTSQHWVA